MLKINKIQTVVSQVFKPGIFITAMHLPTTDTAPAPDTYKPADFTNTSKK
jgi:hypothetical protein